MLYHHLLDHFQKKFVHNLDMLVVMMVVEANDYWVDNV
jgi:hypothetical protein